MSDELAVIDAKFSAPAVAQAAFSAEEALAVNAELQKFIRGLMSDPSTWPKVNGKPEPPATELMKLWSPLGCDAEIVSRNEHGELGVRREVIETLSGGRDIKFSVTLRVVARRLGSAVTVTASQTLLEKVDKSGKPLPEGHVEAQAQTRAQKRALRKIAGFDTADMTKAPPKQSEPLKSDLKERAVRLGCIPQPDRNMFMDWARERVPGCAEMGNAMTIRYATIITEYLDSLEMGG